MTMSAMIWVPNDAESWEPANVISNDGKSVNVRLLDGREVKVPGSIDKFDPIAPGSLEEKCDNLVDLESFSEGIILHHAKTRFLNDVIYTYVGNILIALNPYKPLDIYGLPVIDRIFNLTKSNESTPPHVFSIGAQAVHSLRQDLKDQSVLISGESGAGKTEATKKILQFISTTCGSTASRIGASIENQILDSNPLLESFGNAKTIRNNNSSRFGKYMEVNFSKQQRIKGCNVTAYLLEKSRVVKLGPGERNYHIFYMLLAGAGKEMKSEFNLKPVDQFYYLAQSSCTEVNRRSDLKEFEDLVFSMNSLAIDFNTQHKIFQSLAGVLHLGNLQFSASRDIEGGSKVSVPGDCTKVANLLGIDPEGLQKSLCSKLNVIGGETMEMFLSPDKAVDQRDALAKYFYGKLFDFIVKLVNITLFRGRPALNIGVLDIFGFEVFKLNSFEQLCINYCNERLQTFFNEIIFEGEMKMYAAEGIPCDEISYQDNLGCVRLIDLRSGGVFTFLDEIIVTPKGTDEKFISKLNQVFDETKSTKSIYYIRNRRNPLEFSIRHFAGDVLYNATDFMEKNKDALAEGLLKLIQQSTLDFLIHKEDVNTEETKSNKKKGSKLTLAAKFKNDLDKLMTALRMTAPHFIRCVKPNGSQEPKKFEPPLALNQLKYSGLFEAIRIRKAGFGVRMQHEAFIKRYKHATLTIPESQKSDLKTYSETLLTEMEKKITELKITGLTSKKGDALVPEGGKQWVVGNTRVFLRSQGFKYKLELVREQAAENCVPLLQKVVRGFIVRCRFFTILGEKRAQADRDRRVATAEIPKMENEDIEASAIEKLFREDVNLQRKLAEAKAKRIRDEKERVNNLQYKNAMRIQRVARGMIYRRKGRIFMCERQLEIGLNRREEQALLKGIRMPEKYKVKSKLIKVYKESAKKLMMEVMNESYVSNQLHEAITVGSVEMLKTAIQLAEDSRMPYLDALVDAKEALSNALTLRSVLNNISGVLAQSVTIPKLVANVDLLEKLLHQAAQLGLAKEHKVREAAMRLSRIRNLIVIRNKIRISVEVCSPSKMINAMRERAKILKIYGEDLMELESRAVEGMLHMLNQPQQQHGTSTSTSQSGEGLPGNAGQSLGIINMHELFQIIEEKHAPIDTTPQQEAEKVTADARAGLNGEGSANDVYLPPIVRECLELMRNTTSEKELNEGIKRLIHLVPDETRRRFYVRIFKWVVAFATWRFPVQQRDPFKTSLFSDSPDKNPISDKNTRENMFLSAVGSPTNNKNLPGPQLKSPNKKGVTSPLSFQDQPSPRKKGPPIPNDLKSNAGKSVVTSLTQGSVGGAIPFTHRQARSKVSANESLKKGKKIGFTHFATKTDILINKTIASYKESPAHRQKPATFGG